MNISDNLKNLYQKALTNDGKIDSTELDLLKKEILSDGSVSPEEKAFISDILSKGELDKGAALASINLFDEKLEEKSNLVKDFFEIAISNDGKVDKKELVFLKKELLTDNKISPEEKDFLIENISAGRFTSETIPEIMGLLKDTDTKDITPQVTEDKKVIQTTETPKPVVTVNKVPEKPVIEDKKAVWDHKMSIRGGFNTISVSDGWSKYNSTEKSASKFDIAFEGELNYKKDKHRVNNKVLIEYGSVTNKGEKSSVSKDNQELTSEYTYQIMKKDKFSFELPFVKLFTRGPLTETGNRTFRQSTGLKIVYDNKESKSKYALNLGGGMQQAHDPKINEWNSKPGLEALLEAKQRLSFTKETAAQITKSSEDDLEILDRIELVGNANVFAPLDKGFSSSTMDVTLGAGAKIFLNKSENIWIGASKQWRYGGKPDSSWEDRFVTDIGFKF